MRNSPIKAAVIVFCGYLLCGLLFYKVIGEAPSVIAPATQLNAPLPSSALLSMEFTSVPEFVQIEKGTNVLLRVNPTTPSIQTNLPFSVPSEGVDLFLIVKWKKPTPSAIRFSVQNTQETTLSFEKVIWATNNLEQNVLLP
ncbi:MAG: hypothetical protein SGI71_00045 [Verrucomicrobiota bacterium]|nr:hypothetical protein [Verrucomicrobiota bacterium]